MTSISATLVVFLSCDKTAGEMVFVPETTARAPALAALLDSARAWNQDVGPLPSEIGQVFDDLRGALGRAAGAVWRRSEAEFWHVPQGMAVTRIVPLFCQYDYAHPEKYL